MRIRTLIVDDEPDARDLLASMASAEPDLEVAGQCSSGPEALATLAKQPVSLLLLDVQMPGMTGFELLQAIPAAVRPHVIFVTAYDNFAVRAFEVHALDYLLKPVDGQRFAEAIGRVRRYRAERAARAPAVDQLLEDWARHANSLRRILVKERGRTVPVPVEEIDWIESEGNYVHLHTGARSHLHRETMASLENRLDPARFCRVHRGAIVNLDRVRELRPWFHGDARLLLAGGQEVSVTRGYREELDRRLQQER